MSYKSNLDFNLNNLPVELGLKIIKNLINDCDIETFMNLCKTNKRFNNICKYNLNYFKKDIYHCLLKPYLSSEMVKNLNNLSSLYFVEKIYLFISKNKIIFEKAKEHSINLGIKEEDDVCLFYQENADVFAKYILGDKKASSSIEFLNFIINYPVSYLDRLKLNLERWRNNDNGDVDNNGITDLEVILRSQKVKTKQIKNTLLKILIILFEDNQDSKKVYDIINYILNLNKEILQTIYEYQLIDYFESDYISASPYFDYILMKKQ